MKGSDVIAVQEMPEGTAGAIVLWHLSGDINYARLVQEWREADLDEKLLPDLPSPAVALHRAVEEERQTRRLVRPLGRGAGWAIVQERPTDEKAAPLDYAVTLTAKLDPVGRLVLDPADHPLAAQVEQHFQYHLATLTQGDASSWLTKLVNGVRAVPLRATGGVYFIPRDTVGLWKTMVGALEQASSCVGHEIPALQSKDAVDCILDALARESESVATTMLAEIPELGERGLKARLDQCEAYEAKVASYERLLGQHQQALRDRLQSLKASIAAAILATSDDGAAVADAGTI